MTQIQQQPLFTVVMATWGRGRHIVPSIQSVLLQSFRRFELIVVGDACQDETAAVVAGFADQGVRWINLDERCSSQSAPNNAGIAAARGEIIGYLGHDDIWEPNHLAEIARVFAMSGQADFVVSGLIGHLPNGLKGSKVSGIFTEDSPKHRYFFPPSSFAHRKDVVDRIGLWKMPYDIKAPVDEDLLLRALAANLSFASTQVVTVHKFTAAQRYLCYVQQRSDEQAQMLGELAAPGQSQRIAKIVKEARRRGTYMQEILRQYDHLEPGLLARLNAERRGLLRPKLQPLGAGAVIRQKVELCAMDWRSRPILGIRLNTRNPRPRFLLPYTGTGQTSLVIRVVHPDRLAFGALELDCNEVPVATRIIGLRRSLWGWTARYEAVIDLMADRPSVLEFRLDKQQRKKRRHGIQRVGFGIGKLWLGPVDA